MNKVVSGGAGRCYCCSGLDGLPQQGGTKDAPYTILFVVVGNAVCCSYRPAFKYLRQLGRRRSGQDVCIGGAFDSRLAQLSHAEVPPALLEQTTLYRMWSSADSTTEDGLWRMIGRASVRRSSNSCLVKVHPH